MPAFSFSFTNLRWTLAVSCKSLQPAVNSFNLLLED